MKLQFVGLAILLSLVTASAQFNQRPLISVSGTAAVKVAPDEIHLQVAVETRSETLQPARVENDHNVATALAFLKQAGVPAKNVKTDFISVRPEYDSNRSRVKPSDYVVRKSIEVCLKHIADFQGVLTGLLTNGVNLVDGIDFRTTQLRKYRDQARKMAIDAAKEKAEALTHELGVTLGKPYSISVYENNGWESWNRNQFNRYNAVQNVASAGASTAPDETSGTFAAGQIRVSATVNVSFRIE